MGQCDIWGSSETNGQLAGFHDFLQGKCDMDIEVDGLRSPDDRIETPGRERESKAEELPKSQ
jgi:hypothetical protein